MILFSIFIPLFLLIPCIVFWMDLSLQKIARGEKYRWEPTTPTYGLALKTHTGVTSHMRAIQLNPRFVAAKRTRPHIARTFPVQRRIIHETHIR